MNRVLAFEMEISNEDGINMVAQRTFGLLLTMLRLGPSEAVLGALFSTLRAFAGAYPHVLFNPAADYCQSLCSEVCEGLYYSSSKHSC